VTGRSDVDQLRSESGSRRISATLARLPAPVARLTICVLEVVEQRIMNNGLPAVLGSSVKVAGKGAPPRRAT